MSDSALDKDAGKSVAYKQLIVSSTAFQDDGLIPSKYTCDGKNINPPLDIKQIPEETKCLALIVDDPDAPIGVWVHWLVWNIPVTHHFKENEVHGTEGVNDFQKHHYGGPCPPSGTHRYFFKIYALDTLLELPPSTKKIQLEKAMSGHIIAFGELIGLYRRNN
jgi:Raf kinase inhibitor-like YbhB/YbcL family protein